jgi:hypothetical protein
VANGAAGDGAGPHVGVGRAFPRQLADEIDEHVEPITERSVFLFQLPGKV